jgi:RNA polymerase sigma factor (sigma-70 family)
MAGESKAAVLQQVGRLFREGTLASLPDDRLLARYLDEGDEDAFAVLVARHGPLVLRVCLDRLAKPCSAEAEDVFQATFLALVRSGRSIRGRECLGGWLRRVAARAARRANAQARRRVRREGIAGARVGTTCQDTAEAGLERGEIGEALDAEIARLPESYRPAVELCLVEGLTQPAAAGRLGVSEGVVRGRLARARALLRARLARKGLAPAPLVPPAWIASVVAAGRGLGTPQATSSGVWGWASRAAAVALVATGVATLAAGRGRVQPGAVPGAVLRTMYLPPPAAAVNPPAPAKRAQDADEPVVLQGKVLDPTGRPVAGARLYLIADAWGEPEARGTSGEDGSYRIVERAGTFRHNFGGNAWPQVQATLIVLADGLGAGWVNLEPADGAGGAERATRMRTEYSHDVRLPADCPIEGRIVDMTGKPVAGARVAVRFLRNPADGSWERILHALGTLDSGVLHDGWPHWVYPSRRGAGSIVPPAISAADGRFRIAGVGRDRAVDLQVAGPGILPTTLIVLTRDDVAEITRAIRTRAPRARALDGVLPQWAEREKDCSEHGFYPVFDAAPSIEVNAARTVAGVVSDAGTGAPIERMRVWAPGTQMATTDSQGRYRLVRHDHEPVITVYANFFESDRGSNAARRFSNAGALGEIVADFAIERDVVLAGRVVETGTGRPMVSGMKWDCHGHDRPVAGYAEYVPLASNQALRGTPTGLYFADKSATLAPRPRAEIDGDGRFRMVVPRGPGVLLIQARPGLPFSSPMFEWKESDGVHRLFPYASLMGRRPNDGAPAGDDASRLAGFSGPIELASYHAYKVIDPQPGRAEQDVTIDITRAPSRRVRFLRPDFTPAHGVTVHGLVRPAPWLGGPAPLVVLTGSEAEVLALDPARPRALLVLSNDGASYARASITTADPDPRTIRLQPAGTVTGHLVDAATGGALAGYTVSIHYPGEVSLEDVVLIPRLMEQVVTRSDGRFRVRGIIPGLTASLLFTAPVRPETIIGPGTQYQHPAARGLVLPEGAVRELGELRIQRGARP